MLRTGGTVDKNRRTEFSEGYTRRPARRAAPPRVVLLHRHAAGSPGRPTALGATLMHSARGTGRPQDAAQVRDTVITRNGRLPLARRSARVAVGLAAAALGMSLVAGSCAKPPPASLAQ